MHSGSVKVLKNTFMLFLLVVMVVCTTGCTQVTVLKKNKEIKGLNERIEALSADIASLKAASSDSGIKEYASETSLKMIEGKELPEFITLDSKIVFPNKLTHTTATEDVNDSFVQVGSRFKFAPSENWFMRLSGTMLELSHPSKIWGKLQAIAIDEPLVNTELKVLLQGFYKGFPATTIKYREVYIEDRAVGLISSAEIPVDNKTYVVVAGIVQKGENAVLTLFTYEDSGDKVQKELVDSVLKSGRVSDSFIKLER